MTTTNAVHHCAASRKLSPATARICLIAMFLGMIGLEIACLEGRLVRMSIFVIFELFAWIYGVAILCELRSYTSEAVPWKRKACRAWLVALPLLLASPFWLPGTRSNAQAYRLGYSLPLRSTAGKLVHAMQTPRWAALRAVRTLKITRRNFYSNHLSPTITITLQSGATWSFRTDATPDYMQMYFRRTAGGRATFFLSPYDQQRYADTPKTRQRILRFMTWVLHQYRRHEVRVRARHIQWAAHHSLAQEHQASWS